MEGKEHCVKCIYSCLRCSSGVGCFAEELESLGVDGHHLSGCSVSSIGMTHDGYCKIIVVSCFCHGAFASHGLFCGCSDNPYFSAVFIYGVLESYGAAAGQGSDHVVAAGMSHSS